MKIQKLMMALRIEVARLYNVNAPPKESEKPEIRILRDTRLA
jgi:hypothetical protein